MDGLRTTFVIKNPNETYKYDEDITIPIQGNTQKRNKKKNLFLINIPFLDWYHASSTEGLSEFLNENNPTGAEPVPRKSLLLLNMKHNTYFIL